MAAKPKNLPRELARMTPAQVESVLAYFVTLPISELRFRQVLDNEKIGRAFAMPDGEVRTTALNNLQIDQELLAEAVHRQTFSPHHRTIDVSRWL